MVVQFTVLDGTSSWHLTNNRRPVMNTCKVTQNASKGKSQSIDGNDHYVAVDWSLRVMAIAHMTRRSKQPTVFERPSDIKYLKDYLDAMTGRVVVAIEETTTAQW